MPVQCLVTARKIPYCFVNIGFCQSLAPLNRAYFLFIAPDDQARLNELHLLCRDVVNDRTDPNALVVQNGCALAVERRDSG
jgi:hypothetical protein